MTSKTQQHFESTGTLFSVEKLWAARDKTFWGFL
jgi:hypothetical protein